MKSLAELGKTLNTSSGLLCLIAGLIVFITIGLLATRKVLRKEYRGQFAVILFLIYLCIAFLIISFSFRKSGPVSAALLPRLWIYSILLSSIYLLYRIFSGIEKSDPVQGSFHKPIPYILVCFAYAAVMPYLGFFLASLVFLIIGIVLLNYRKWTVIIAISIGWILFNYFLFYKLLFVPFPEGVILPLLKG